MNTRTLDEARAAKAYAADLLEPLGTAVAGIGITRVEAGYGLKINLQDQPADRSALPDEVNGVPVRFEVIGRIQLRGAVEESIVGTGPTPPRRR